GRGFADRDADGTSDQFADPGTNGHGKSPPKVKWPAYNGRTTIPARRPCAGRCRAGEGVAWRHYLTGRVCWSITSSAPRCRGRGPDTLARLLADCLRCGKAGRPPSRIVRFFLAPLQFAERPGAGEGPPAFGGGDGDAQGGGGVRGG